MSKWLCCIVCRGTMQNIDEDGNQPSGGVAFSTSGHYGSTVFDPMDGTVIEINVCDDCLRLAGIEGVVREAHTAYVKAKTTYSQWKPDNN